MKRVLLMFALLATFGGFAQIEVPSPSPDASVYSKVGLTDVRIDYNRPKVRGRELFGSDNSALLPYGAYWRTGAGKGTILHISTEIEIKGNRIEPGDYLILTVPNEKIWSFILYNNLNVDGANLSGSYNVDDEVFRTEIEVFEIEEEVQSLTFQISDISDDNTMANIEFSWGNVGFKVPFTVSYDEEVLADISSHTVVEPINYIKAARYYLEHGKDLEQALEWVNLYFAIDGTETHFWYMYLKAQILAELGRKDEAIEVANKSIELAKLSERGDLGYIKRNQVIIDSLQD